MKKPILIDELYDSCPGSVKTVGQINKEWVFAKPLQYRTIFTIITDLYHCYLIMRGKAAAYQYQEDRE